MTQKEEQELLDDVYEIKQIVKENNKLLKQIVNYINYISAKSNSENIDDFGRNVIANLISTKLFK